MKFDDWVRYQLSRKPWSPSSESLTVLGLGLAGESGEVLEHFKKHVRDGKPLIGNTELALELGDVLFYWLKLLQFTGFTIEEVLSMNREKLISRDIARGVG